MEHGWEPCAKLEITTRTRSLWTRGSRCLLFIFYLPWLSPDTGKDKKQSCPPREGSSFNMNKDFAKMPHLPLPVSLGTELWKFYLLWDQMLEIRGGEVLTRKHNADET